MVYNGREGEALRPGYIYCRFTPVLERHLLQMDDISVADPCLGRIKQSVLVALMAKHDDDDDDDKDDDDDTSRERKVRKHEESFIGILSHLQKIPKNKWLSYLRKLTACEWA